MYISLREAFQVCLTFAILGREISEQEHELFALP